MPAVPPVPSRRRLLKAACAALGGFAPLLGAGGASASEEEKPQAVLIDVDACTGCGACVIACRQRNLPRIPIPETPIPIPAGRRIQDWSSQRGVTDRLTPYNWLYIQSCTVQTRQVHLPRRCMHCANPPCVSLCPVAAGRQDRQGATYISSSVCLGDGQCSLACPWRIPRRQSGVGPYLQFLPRHVGAGLTFHCDFCRDLLARGERPACVAACPRKAQHSGSRERIVRLAKKLARERGGEIFGLKENGGTNTLYVSSLPFATIEAALLLQEQIDRGRPSLRPAGASLARENSLLRNVLLAPVAGLALSWIRLWRDRQGQKK